MRRIAPLLIGAAIAVLAAAGFAEQQEKERQVCPITWLTAPQTHDEAEFITLTNADRRKLGLRPLALDPTLQQVARTDSWEMYAKDYFDHRSPSAGQSTPMDRYLKGGGSYRRRIIVGENLYYCTRADVQRGHTAFMHSPGHRKNILDPEWEQMGVGVYQAPNGRFWVTEMFLYRR